MAGNPSMTGNLIKKVTIILLFTYAVGILLISNKAAFTQGILFGGIFTILKILLMDRTIKRAIKKTPERAKSYVQAHYMLRYLLSFIVLFVSIVTPSIDILGTSLSLLSLKLAAYWQGLMEPKTPLDGSVEFLEWEDEEKESDF